MKTRPCISSIACCHPNIIHQGRRGGGVVSASDFAVPSPADPLSSSLRHPPLSHSASPLFSPLPSLHPSIYRQAVHPPTSSCCPALVGASKKRPSATSSLVLTLLCFLSSLSSLLPHSPFRSCSAHARASRPEKMTDRDVLPDNVKPSHYVLSLRDLDFKAWTYKGTVTYVLLASFVMLVAN